MLDKIQALSRSFGGLVVKNSPVILVVAGTASVVTAIGLTVRSTVKAVHILDNELTYDDEPTKADIIRAVWKEYIPPISMAAVGIACFIGSNRVMSHRIAVLATAHTLSEKAFTEYRKKVVDVMGEEEEKEKVGGEIAQDHLNRNNLVGNEVILTRQGTDLCYDPLSGRYFRSDMESLRAAENSINRDILAHMWRSLNTYYDYLGIETTDLGDVMGWNSDDPVCIEYNSKIASNGEPCIVLRYIVEPKPDYYRMI